MAYAFDKVDDYFRRQKTGERGSLNKGTQGAPPPTAAADSLAKQAETSAEIGNAETGAFRANKGVNQQATQQALVQPAKKQATEWGATQEKRAQDFQKEGEQRIAQTYQAYNPADIAKIEAGDQAATTKAMQQRGYTGKELTWQPYQVEAPQIDTTSMLKGGVGGIQAALQKQKGGRYTGGMAALDASMLAGNREAIQGTQQQLGDIYSGAREKQATLEQTDENLAKQASDTATTARTGVQKALEARKAALDAAYAQKISQGAAARRAANRAGVNERQAMINALTAQGLTVMQALDILGLGTGSADIANRMALYNPQAVNNIIAQQRNVGGYVQAGPMATYSAGPDVGMTNIYSALGMSPQEQSAQYQTYGINQAGMNNAAANLAREYRYLTSIQGVAPVSSGATGESGPDRELNTREWGESGPDIEQLLAASREGGFV